MGDLKMTVINKNETVIRDSDTSKTYRELSGSKAIRMLKALPKGGTWQRKGLIDLVTPKVEAAVNVYEVNGKAILGSIHVHGTIGKLFVLPSPQSMTDFVTDMVDFRGYTTREKMNTAIENVSGDNAKQLYGEESKLFGEHTLAEVHNVSKLSNIAAKEVTKNTLSTVVTKTEVFELVQTISDVYGMKNVEVVFQPFNGKHLGSCGPAKGSDNSNTCWLSLPVGITLTYSDSVLYQHLIFHELAHAIELWQTGQTSHGKRFREIYVDLLNTYADGNHNYSTLL